MKEFYSVITIEKGDSHSVAHSARTFFSKPCAKKFFEREKARIKDTYGWIEECQEHPEFLRDQGFECVENDDCGYFYAYLTSDDGWDRYMEVCLHEDFLDNVLIVFEWETGDSSVPVYEVCRTVRLDAENAFQLDMLHDFFVNHAEDFEEKDMSYEEITDAALDFLDLDYDVDVAGQIIDTVRHFRI